jgi:hypothetical protein
LSLIKCMRCWVDHIAIHNLPHPWVQTHLQHITMDLIKCDVYISYLLTEEAWGLRLATLGRGEDFTQTLQVDQRQYLESTCCFLFTSHEFTINKNLNINYLQRKASELKYQSMKALGKVEGTFKTCQILALEGCKWFGKLLTDRWIDGWTDKLIPADRWTDWRMGGLNG